MNGRRLLVFTSLLLAVFIAVPGVAAAKAGGTDRPIKGSGSATDTLDLATGTGTGEGPAVISHLGKGTFSHSFAVTLTGPTTFTVVSTETFTAANGDRLFATFAGGGVLTGFGVGETAHITGTITITGGTGRFADASGTLTGTFHAETLSSVGTTVVNRDTFTVEGRISY
jgi:hypothetical protein